MPDAPAPRTASPAPKPKAGVPVWRVGKPDAFLAAAVDTARTALTDIARPDDVGDHIAAKSEGERVVTHLFESRLRGYRGWQWFVTVARVARSKTATVSEIGLVPSKDAILAPEWVPWSERVRPEDSAVAEAEKAGPAEPGAAQGDAHDGAPAASEGGSPEEGQTGPADAEAPDEEPQG